jgi:hypothetical protein
MVDRVTSNSLDTRALLMLRDKLTYLLNETHTNLGSGTQIIREDAAATGMNMVKYVGMIAGLQAAVHLLGVVDDEINGRIPGA